MGTSQDNTEPSQANTESSQANEGPLRQTAGTLGSKRYLSDQKRVLSGRKKTTNRGLLRPIEDSPSRQGMLSGQRKPFSSQAGSPYTDKSSQASTEPSQANKWPS